jgi:hypothetical protein
MTCLRLAAVALALGWLAGCGALTPYPTVPIAARPGMPASPRVAICYNTLTTPLAEVQREAQQECPADTSAEPDDTDYYLQNCPLLLPGRASFICRPRK